MSLDSRLGSKEEIWTPKIRTTNRDTNRKEVQSYPRGHHVSPHEYDELVCDFGVSLA